MVNSKVYLGVLTSLLLIQPSFSAMADNSSKIEALSEQLNKVKISGYLNLTAAQAEKKNFSLGGGTVYGDDLSTTTETLGGIQLDFQATEDLKATVLTKFVAEEPRFGGDSFIVDLAYLTYQMFDRTQLKAGILRIPLYKDSDYFDMGFAHLWLRTPSLIYGANTKVQRHTGIEVLHDIDIGDGILQLQGFWGQNEDIEATAGCDCGKTFKIDDIKGLHVNYSLDDHFFKVGYMTRTEPGELEDFLTVTDETLALDNNGNVVVVPPVYKLSNLGYWAGERQSFTSIGYGYDDGEWKVDVEEIFEIHEGPKQDKAKTFISVGRRFDDLTPYVMYTFEETIDNEKRFDGASDYVYPNGATRRNFYNTKSSSAEMFSLGGRYDINYNMALKFQVDKSRAKRTTIDVLRWNGLAPGVTSRTDNVLYSISLQMIF